MSSAFDKIPKRHRDHIGRALKADHQEWQSVMAQLNKRLGSGMIVALLGARGTGKTQLAACLCFYADRERHSFRYVTAFEMFASIKESYRDGSAQSEVMAIRDFTIPSLLVVDELNEANQTTWEGHMLAYIIDKRYAAANKDTLIISNDSKEDFNSHVGSSIVSRMEECGGHIVCAWESFRGKTGPNKKGEPG